MPIHRIDPPETDNQAAIDRLASLERARGHAGDLEAGGGPDMHPEGVLEMYHLDHAEAGQPLASLSEARPVGWQYLIRQTHAITSVEVVDGEAVAIDKGQVASDIAHALEVAGDNASDQDYEARMLTFGRAGENVLWLHPQDGGAERFFTLGPSVDEVEPADVLAGVSRNAAVRRDYLPASFVDLDDESGG